MLDTSVCIAIMRTQASALARLMKFAPSDCVVSSVAAYELYTGVAKSREPERERAKVGRLLSAIPLLEFDDAAAKAAGTVRAVLERHGNRCGPYDLLLAGHALSLDLPFATNNAREFARVQSLQVENWLD